MVDSLPYDASGILFQRIVHTDDLVLIERGIVNTYLVYPPRPRNALKLGRSWNAFSEL